MRAVHVSIKEKAYPYIVIEGIYKQAASVLNPSNRSALRIQGNNT